MTKLPLVYNRFDGGMSTDLKLGIPNSFAYSQSVDFRKSPSQMTVLPKPTQEDTEVVKDLIQNEVMVPSGIIYALGDQGFFYKRTTAGVWSTEANLNAGTFGLDYRKDTDSIYICGQKSVSLYNQVSTSPTIYPDYYGQSFSTLNNSDSVGFNVSAYQQGSTNATVLATAIIEDQVHRRYFQSDIEPLSQLSATFASFGNVTVTATVHDGNDNVIATSTRVFSTATDTPNQSYDFPIAIPARIYVAPNARTYHIHWTVNTGTATSVTSSVTNDLSSMDLKIWADRFVQTTNGMHPQARFLQYQVFGNANYLSVWEPLSDPPTNNEWLRHRLVFPMEYEVCGLAVQNEFLVIAAEKNTTTDGFTQQQGILFFWDGTSPTYNYDVRIPEGSPYALHEYENVIYYYAGGAWYTITGPASQPRKIRTMPGTDTEYSGTNSEVIVYPYAATVRRGIHMLGWPSSTTNTSINFGVYSWGAVDKNFPESFGYSYLLSTGTKNYTAGNNLQIGMVKAFGDIMHTSWRDGAAGAPVTTGLTSPTVGADDSSIGTVNWNSVSNITSSDNQYATASLSEVTGLRTTHYLVGSAYGFALPADAQVTGIEVAIEHKANSTNRAVDNAVRLVRANGTFGTANRADAANYWPASDTIVTYGSPTDLWDDAWTPTDINSANFGAALSATLNLSSGAVTASVDHIRINVYYTRLTTNCGIDVITNASLPSPTAIWESRIFDNGFVARQKLGLYLQVTCLELPTDASFVIKYSLNRGDWVYSDPFDSTNIVENIARFDITRGRFYEIQMGIEIVSGTTTPTVTSVTLIFDDNRAEELS